MLVAYLVICLLFVVSLYWNIFNSKVKSVVVPCLMLIYFINSSFVSFFYLNEPLIIR